LTLIDGIDARQVEELLLHATEPHTQLPYDGWLLRFAPDDAKRAGSVNAAYGSTRPLEEKIGRCEAAYEGRGLTPLFRLTPFSQPPELDAALEARGYRSFERSLVLATSIAAGDLELAGLDLRFEWPSLEDWSQASGRLHGRSPDEDFARLTRLKICKVPARGLLAWSGDQLVGCGSIMVEGEWAGLFEIFVLESRRGSGIGRALTARLMAEARDGGATHAWLSVLADNAPALSVYHRLGFETLYEYWYRIKPEARP
jgi:ribosomal protein S18 acetylase RimI-like enzyme